MSDAELREYVRRLVDPAPPLTPEQKETIRSAAKSARRRAEVNK